MHFEPQGYRSIFSVGKTANVETTLLNASTGFTNGCSFFHQMAYRLTYFTWLTFSDRLAYFGVPIVHAFWACLQCTRLFCSSSAACIHRVHGRTFIFFSINWKGTEECGLDLHFRFDIQTRSNSTLKGQLDSEWIHEVIVSPKMQTKNLKDFFPTLL